MKNLPLTKAQGQELMRLALRTYHDQANTCYKAKAYLASCIMLGAAVEAVLTAVTSYLYDEALKTGKAPKYKRGHPRQGETQDLLDWQFSHLLDVAKKANWLPEKLPLNKRADSVRTDSIREFRNLVHPARYLQDRSGKEYTEEELSIL